MATPKQWIEGARPRTLPNAIAPVVVGVGAVRELGDVTWWKAVLALLVAVALIIGVNFANDYSDGVRGTDDDRVGPMRLVGSRAATPDAVKRAAFLCFGIGAVCGLALAITTAWWLIVVGAVCIAGAWFYTGGKRPYGYIGLGEIAVFTFFGLVAVMGTQFVVSGRVDWIGLVCAIGVGAISTAVLVVNNLRDIPSDTESGKITLAVRLGDKRTRLLFAALVAAPLVVSIVLVIATPWALLGLLAAPLMWIAYRPVRSGAVGPALIPSLGAAGQAMLAWAVLTAVGLVLP
ncbi:1,4-dihydroxy-2-naphthoate polyprenyltransferase [Gordonia sp. zg691]|uniref:1,4-dihydroxy-2-naphthoate octaprenyltransferase n=1 Tax=Gordonia jinghuaiqii TaxID=2758710 RepID=A0A7D7QR13_9ACTN|nr:1,4-dihydroxy-2-naphthoate polyprenyltransferase [Gordonia jinghuaiqii]MBD0861902.1 1,4-dihydroxy-2-naphthoate polyprenyltransferase [Gordonia jinghuaiqii]MCR5977807.1 1,4-dihydroxy-2-naphthoate polyprenyltransferase [Gordonia jinghuaiqii]QMT02466.1 1,4-dihydroxy-2-naphthoate polyprenyltransferase [Gordonia jinghuaiqii]